MSKILAIISNSSNGEVDATGNAMVMALKKKDWTGIPVMETLVGSLEELRTQLNEAIKRGVKESELDEKDQARDGALSAFYYLIKGFSMTENDSLSVAQQVLDKLDHYGLTKTTQANYANESAYINSLITDLETEPLKSSLNVMIYATTSLQKLKDAQADFEQTYDEYMEAMAELGSLKSATTLKKELVKVINQDLVSYLNLMTKMDAATYGEISIKVGEIINDNNERVNRRRKKK
ncbi:MAG: DUF6261 family protein [Mangrovibacterium sp.]